MSNFSRLQVLNTIVESGVLPILSNNDIEVCKNIVTACYNGGIRVFEITNRGKCAHETFAELNKWAGNKYPDLILGAGSIVDGPTAALYIQMGANFLVSPLFNPEIAKICNRRKIAWIPGCATLTEINMAEETGVEIVKLFPANEIGGPAFIKAVKAPCPWTTILATGGIIPTKEVLKSWFDAGTACVGLGSQLFPNELVANGKFDEIENIVREVLNIIAHIKNTSKQA